MLVGYQYTGETNKRGGGAAPPVRPCKDGYINMGIALYWMDRVAAMLGRPEIAKDPRFVDPAQYKKPENAEAFEAIYLEWLSQRTMAEAWEAGQKYRVLSGPIYSVADVMKDRNFRERGYWERIEHPVAGAYEYPGLPFKTFGAPRQPRRPAPRLGEHTDEVLRSFGYGPRQIARLRRDGVVA
jgi:crotonobetainyl-CoA:carnitine CoA-transferase CaiB-like acyl-CoA transferase